MKIYQYGVGHMTKIPYMVKPLKRPSSLKLDGLSTSVFRCTSTPMETNPISPDLKEQSLQIHQPANEKFISYQRSI